MEQGQPLSKIAVSLEISLKDFEQHTHVSFIIEYPSHEIKSIIKLTLFKTQRTFPLLEMFLRYKNFFSCTSLNLHQFFDLAQKKLFNLEYTCFGQQNYVVYLYLCSQKILKQSPLF